MARGLHGAAFGGVAARLEIIYKPPIIAFLNVGGPAAYGFAQFLQKPKILNVGAKTYHYFSLKAAERHGLPGISRLPFSR